MPESSVTITGIRIHTELAFTKAFKASTPAACRGQVTHHQSSYAGSVCVTRSPLDLHGRHGWNGPVFLPKNLPAVFHTAMPGGAARQKTRRKRHKPRKGLVKLFPSPNRQKPDGGLTEVTVG